LFTVDQLAKLNFSHPMAGISSGGRNLHGEKAYAYVETGFSAKALESLTHKLSGM